MLKLNLITLFLSVGLLLLPSALAETSQDLSIIRNLAFIGSTGNGKSATCNTLFGERSDYPFKVGHRAAAETSQIVDFVSKTKNIRIIDTPGFGDNRYDEAQINSMLRQFTQTLMSPFDMNNPQIDAFVLVVRLNPRATSLKNDLLQARDLFGSVVLKSVILLVINMQDPNSTKEEFLSDLKDMKEITNLLKAAKQEEPNENWFVLWDNKSPRAGQEEELLAKIKKLEPYTHKKFIEADQEIKQRINAQIKASVERETQRIKREFQDDKESLEKQLNQMEGEFAKVKEALFQSRKDALALAEQTQKSLTVFSEKQGGINWKDTILAGFVGSRFGPIGAIVSAIAVNLIPDIGDIQYEDESDL